MMAFFPKVDWIAILANVAVDSCIDDLILVVLRYGLVE